jgi:hypothetical protein
MQTLIKSWWLLAVGGILYALFSAMIVLMQTSNGSIVSRTNFYTRDAITQLGLLALAAGACTIAAALSSGRKGSSWLLVLNGLACAMFGLMVLLGATRHVTFPTLAIMVIVMATSVGMYEFATARASRGRVAEEWLLGAAGVVSVGFAVAFLAFVLRWITLDPTSPAQSFYWLGSYFAYSAICMVGLALQAFRPLANHRMVIG